VERDNGQSAREVTALARRAWRAALHDLAYQYSPVPFGRHTADRESYRVIVVRARFGERWYVIRQEDERKAKGKSCEGGRVPTTIAIGGRAAAGGGGSGSGGDSGSGGSGGGSSGCGRRGGSSGGECSKFRECPRKTSAASHHGEPTEIQ